MALPGTLPALLLLSLTQIGQLPPEGEVQAEAVHELGTFLEGLVFADDGTAFVSDVPGGTVYRFQQETHPRLGQPLLGRTGTRSTGTERTS